MLSLWKSIIEPFLEPLFSRANRAGVELELGHSQRRNKAAIGASDDILVAIKSEVPANAIHFADCEFDGARFLFANHVVYLVVGH